MSQRLLVLWIALIGADRLDLGGGAAPFVLTPFLVLTPLLVMAQAADRSRRHVSLQVTGTGVAYAALLGALLTLVVLSVIRSLDMESSIPRAALITIQSVGALAVAAHIATDESSQRALRKGAALGTVLFGIVGVLSIFAYVGMIPDVVPIGFASLELISYDYAGIFPRLSGMVRDPNRAGLVLLFFLVVSRRFMLVGGILLILTLSRSAGLALLGVIVVKVIKEGFGGVRVSPRQVLASLALVAVAALAIGRSPQAMEDAEIVTRVITERFSVDRGTSAYDHQALIVRAGYVGTRSPERALLGLGWGASHVVLQDFFPGNRYGNFHSLYAAAFVEAGIFAAVLFVILMAIPLVRRNPWQGLVFGCVLFNLFYQTPAEPVFWLILSMAWFTMHRKAVVAPHAAATGAPRVPPSGLPGQPALP